MSAHANCTHEVTPAARAACRKARAIAADARYIARNALISELTRGYEPRPNHWLFAGASRFAGIRTDDVVVAADAILDYFDSSTAYTRTTDPARIRLIILTAFS